MPSSIVGFSPGRGVRHEIDLVPATKFCVTRQCPLPKEQGDIIDEFFCAKYAAGMCVRVNLRTLHPLYVLRNPTVSGALFMLIISLMQPLSLRRSRFHERKFFRTIWLAATCIAHSIEAMISTSFLCEQVTFHLQQ